MKAIIIFVVAFTGICVVSCNKDNVIKVNGTINGIPAISLYGNSGRSADYVLLSTDSAEKEISYDGTAYKYQPVSTSGSGIFIYTSSFTVQSATLATSNGVTVLTIAPSTQNIFVSSLYVSK